MGKNIQWIENNHENRGKYENSKRLFPLGISRKTRIFHDSIPDFEVTPLKSLRGMANYANLGGIWVKDESNRLNLNSFKVLGGSYAIYRFLKNKLGSDKEFSYEKFVSPEMKEKFGEITFATATDGNHGRGVAWAANKLGHKSVIYVHANTSQPRIDAIRSYGATVKVVEGNYDDAVNQVSEDAKTNGWQIISDTSWPGYQEIPTWIMQGYTTIVSEIQEQFSAQGILWPTHIFIQAGVGALAASILGHYHTLLGKKSPISVVVEPDKAACIYSSIKANDGKPHNFPGDLDTIMAGLACGDPSPIAWNVLTEATDFFISVPDYIAAEGMRMYAVPLKDDPFVVSGESGAVTLSTLVSIMLLPELKELKEKLHLDKNSKVLLINSEGNTDPINFRKVVWEGSNLKSLIK
ncbi:MAG: diaminopropionate ammonia-lyase [Candidatus Cloacimonadota bacterium]|nr:diaminopropionate ammonia-lyase [Candidatus Cloacimonadota bacterium]